MNKVIAAAVAALMIAPALSAQVYVRGYTRSDGTYVAPHYRSLPNRSVYDNYSTRGNYNPYTGKAGTRNPYSPSTYSSPTYGTPYGSSPKQSYGSSYPCYYSCR